MIIITGHIDSRVTDPMNATADAPGANDDGSGTAAVIEAARVLSRHRFPATIVYAVLSGEEQGLNGGKILADYARAQGWQVEANLNNDIVGNQLRLGRGLRRRPCPGLLRRAALAGRQRSSPRGSAASAARTIRRRAISRASSTRWPTSSASASTSARSGATTASAAAATIPSS